VYIVSKLVCILLAKWCVGIGNPVYLSYCAMTHGAQYTVPTESSAPTTIDPVNGMTVLSTVPPMTVTDPSTIVSTLGITLAPTRM
jgi:hypothetical protein